MSFYISQRLIQHQIVNYTEILKWLREILICRNRFLLKHSATANVGSNIPVCRQAHIKLEVRLVDDGDDGDDDDDDDDDDDPLLVQSL